MNQSTTTNMPATTVQQFVNSPTPSLPWLPEQINRVEAINDQLRTDLNRLDYVLQRLTGESQQSVPKSSSEKTSSSSTHLPLLSANLNETEELGAWLCRLANALENVA